MESATPMTSRMSHAFFMNGSKCLIGSPIIYNDLTNRLAEVRIFFESSERRERFEPLVRN
jgi:hypothetical protein